MAQYACPSCFTDLGVFKSRYPLDYRLVVTRSLYCCIHSGKTSEELKKQLEEASAFIKELIHTGKTPTTKSLYFPGFIELCVFRKGDRLGILLIDRSDGCFPLVAYPDDSEDDTKGNRVSGINMAFQDLCGCFDSLISAYDQDFKHKWDDIRKELITSIYNYNFGSGIS